MIYLRLFRESYIFAIRAIIANKTRTILTLLGITIGIFAIIAVFSVFDSVEKKIRTNINELGNKTLFIQKWPWAMGGSEYPWWKYYKRPEASINDLNEILKRSETVKYGCYVVGISRLVENRNTSSENNTILGISYQYKEVKNFNISNGRYFTPAEMQTGNSIVMIGHKLKESLFKTGDPIGKEIKISGKKVTVIGVISEEGDDIFGDSHDWFVITPINYLRTITNIKERGSYISLTAKEFVSIDQMRDELVGILRSVRRLKPGVEDNFAINETSILTKGFKDFFGIVTMIGWIIGGFSLLVGGFGIANIMFVSVKERTGQIGIQKSLGAKNYFILLQFLFEAIFLSIIGGLLGLIIVFLGTLLLNSLDIGIDFAVSIKNITLALSVSGLIGLASGFIPAYQASKLDPVEAIRAT
ncbi:MAG: ABC transporter permease [Bacteroidota bacterium]|nr:ABC transporter permease [Bacteroidota bacterium]